MAKKRPEDMIELSPALSGRATQIASGLMTVEAEALEKVIKLLVDSGFTLAHMELRVEDQSSNFYKELWCAGKCVCSVRTTFNVTDGRVEFSLIPYPEGRLR